MLARFVWDWIVLDLCFVAGRHYTDRCDCISIIGTWHGVIPITTMLAPTLIVAAISLCRQSGGYCSLFVHQLRRPQRRPCVQPSSSELDFTVNRFQPLRLGFSRQFSRYSLVGTRLIWCWSIAATLSVRWLVWFASHAQTPALVAEQDAVLMKISPLVGSISVYLPGRYF